MWPNIEANKLPALGTSIISSSMPPRKSYTASNICPPVTNTAAGTLLLLLLLLSLLSSTPASLSINVATAMHTDCCELSTARANKSFISATVSCGMLGSRCNSCRVRHGSSIRLASARYSFTELRIRLKSPSFKACLYSAAEAEAEAEVEVAPAGVLVVVVVVVVVESTVALSLPSTPPPPPLLLLSAGVLVRDTGLLNPPAPPLSGIGELLPLLFLPLLLPPLRLLPLLLPATSLLDLSRRIPPLPPRSL
mmetsp:Transcript_6573/g.11044  ORF Transcript_6573/g.11044 Transcript_6573/m.11044 type:complete len:251 (-) Transcript_6573:32-784(-)